MELKYAYQKTDFKFYIEFKVGFLGR